MTRAISFLVLIVSFLDAVASSSSSLGLSTAENRSQWLREKKLANPPQQVVEDIHYRQDLFSSRRALASDSEDGSQNGTQVLFIPSYANESSNGSATVWNIRMYGLVYRQEGSQQESKLFSSYLNSSVISALEKAAQTPEEKDNLTANLALFLYWKYLDDVQVTASAKPSGETPSFNITTKEGSQKDGHFDEFVPVVNVSGMTPGSILNLTLVDPSNANTTDTRGNVSLVHATGYSVISDIDDVLRVTKIWEPLTGLTNTFVKAYEPVEGMPEVFAGWQKNLTNVSFHYGTTTPIPLVVPYIRWLEWKYPYGSIDMRPMDITEPSEVLEARSKQLERLFNTFPGRKFVMVGDTSSNTLIKAYPDFAKKYPNQTACIFIRNTTATYPDFSSPLVNLQKSFDGVPPEKWFVFDNASTLNKINIESGNCHPPGLPENQTTESGGFGGTGNDKGSISNKSDAKTLSVVQATLLWIPLLAMTVVSLLASSPAA